MRTLTFLLAVVFGLSAQPFALAAKEPFKPFLGQVKGDGINIRTDSTSSSEVISTLKNGDLIAVTAERYDWYKIKLPRSAPSFVRKDLVTVINSNTAKIAKSNVNIRLAPTENAPIVGKAYQDEVIIIVGTREKWYRIEPVDNSSGWVYKKFVSKAKDTFTKEDLQPKPAPAATVAVTIPQPVITNNNIAVEGELQPHGALFFRSVTHKLITQEDKIFLLKGNRKVLAALKYHKVRIVGKISTQPSLAYPLIEIEKIEDLD
jgi:uncharacterized protein YgiM (DUF1202 family)